MRPRQRHVLSGLVLLLVLPAALRGQGATSLAHTNAAGVQGNAGADSVALGVPPVFVVFQSSATNLVPGDTNGAHDLFLKNLVTGAVERINVTSTGAEAGACFSSGLVSADGRFVAFTCQASNLVPGDFNGVGDVFVRDRQLGTTTRINLSPTGAEANGGSICWDMSTDGAVVVYTSSASNLVPGDTNGAADVFVFDAVSGTTTRVSVSTTGVEGNADCQGAALSSSTRYVFFGSLASTLVFGDTNGVRDIFRHDRVTGVTDRVSVTASGAQANGHCEFNGGQNPLSSNGDSVVFMSLATNLVPGDANGVTDVFVKDLNSGAITRASVSSSGAEGDQYSTFASISLDGRFVCFTSLATNLVPGDTNGNADLFVRDLALAQTIRVNVSSVGAQSQIPCIAFPSNPCGGQYMGGEISYDGSLVAYDHPGGALLPGGDANGNLRDVFVTEIGARLGETAPPVLGSPYQLQLRAPSAGSAAYALALSASYFPGIPLGARRIPLEPDALFQASLAPSPFFLSFAGFLDASGLATATILVPPLPSLAGVTLYAAFATGDPQAYFGIGRLSNAHRIQL